ncbi:MAG: cysteine desulfurase [Saprospiraceae bacterium]|nr:cysteine desulfurase [Saprospiraceae bacterium]
MRLYFDNAASTPLFPEVIEVMHKAMADYFGNPSSIHAHGRKAKAAIEEARKVIAYHLGCSVGELFFTSGGSEANNLALKGAIYDLGIGRVITSRIEHPCVLRSIEHMAVYRDFDVDYLNVSQDGVVDLDHLETLLKQNAKEKTLVSVMHANNEIGSMNDIDAIGELCRKYDAYFHSDTVQTVGHFPIRFGRLKVDMAAASAHKFHGPKGIGFLYLNQRCNQIRPPIDGGGQERNLRAGTENISSILGMAKAMELYCENMEQNQLNTRSVREYAMQQVQLHFPDTAINGAPEDQSLYTVLSVTFPPSKRSELLIFNLDIEGVSASGGSACSSGVQKVSHVLAEIAPNDPGTTVRFSFSPLNRKEEIDLLIEKLHKILQA